MMVLLESVRLVSVEVEKGLVILSIWFEETERSVNTGKFALKETIYTVVSDFAKEITVGRPDIFPRQ